MEIAFSFHFFGSDRWARNIMFAESGDNIPFKIECFAYTDKYGRETLSLNRSFTMSLSAPI